MPLLTPSEILTLSQQALVKAGASEQNASPLAEAIKSAEMDGISSHGLMYLPTYCLHLQCGKVDGLAQPEIDWVKPSLATVNARTGFAHSAIAQAIPELVQRVSQQGIACIQVWQSYNCGVLGYHTEQLAKQGILALGCTNAPASIAPVGGSQPVIGTNPISIAVPRGGGKGGEVALVIDQSASVVAKSEVVKHNLTNKPVPLGWVLDSEGNPTTDAAAGLKGSMVPSGGYKGFGIGFIVELLAAALSGAELGIHASPFAGDSGGPPKTGQCFIGIAVDAKPADFEGHSFNRQVSMLLQAIESQQAHVPGNRRFANRQKAEQQGVWVEDTIYDKAKALI